MSYIILYQTVILYHHCYNIVYTLLTEVSYNGSSFLLLVLPTPNIRQGYSHCMADCNMGQHGPSLYEQYCCQYDNRGKRFHLKENGLIRFILCPSTRPSSCP